MHHSPRISVSAVVLTNDDGRVALVRKRDTRSLMFPGGKPEPGEDGVATAVREVYEELGVVLDPNALDHLGDYTTAAANEAGTELFSQVYQAQLAHDADVAAQAEIAELIWAHPGDVELPVGTDLAPLCEMIFEELEH